MKFTQITVGGAVPFPTVQTIIIPNVQTVAITGDNGAGKSTLLDCIYIALYGDTTKPGGLYPLFPSKDGIVELHMEYNGAAIVIKRLIDGVARKQRVFVWRNGECLTEGKVGQGADAVAAIIGVPEDVFLASVYNAQTQKGNPLSLKDGDRRSLLGKILGLDAFDAPHAAVCAKMELTDGSIKTAEATKAVFAAQVGTGQTMTEIGFAQVALCDATKAKGEAQTELDRCQQALADLRAANTDAQEATENHRRLTAAIATSKAAIADLQQRIENNKTHLLGQAAAINDAVDKLPAASTATATCTTELERLRAETADILTRYQKPIGDSLMEVYKLEQELAAIIKEVQAAESLAGCVMPAVPCNADGVYSTCPLLGGKKQEIDAATAKLPALNATKAQAVLALDTAKADLARLQSAKQDETVKNGNAITAATETLTAAQTTEAGLKKLANLKPQLELAEKAIGQYTTQVAELESKITTDNVELARWAARMDAAAGLAEAQVAQQTATTQLQQADAALFTASQTIGRLESKLATEQEAAKRVEELNATIAAEHETLRDLSILKQALGPKGARALKIDAAGPAISTIANTLLRECFGSRFTILIKTQRALIKDDSELRECLEFYIIDHETGEESPVEQKSGGEQQLIREVVSLALCIYQRKQTGADLRTVIRDEACSALTEANSMKYVVMLQKACEIGEFDQVLFVSHKTCAQGLAGATIHVMNGGIIG